MGSFQHKTEDKLIILYVLNKIKIGLSREQLAYIIVQNLQMRYMDIQVYIDQLVNDHLIREDRHNGAKLFITPEGSEMVEQLGSRIPKFTQEMLSAFIKNNKSKIFKETRTEATYQEVSPNDYQVSLSLVENNINLMHLTLSCPDKAQALALCDQWKRHTQSIYASIIQSLVEGE
jgi:predicted transcriptional regulator